MKNLFSPFLRMISAGTLFVDNTGGPGAGAPPATPPSNPPTYTQADVDRIAAERVAAATSQYSGIDPKEFERLKTEDAARQRKEAERKGEYEKIIAQQKTEHDTETGKLKAQLSAERIDGALVREAAAQNAISPEQVKDLLKGNVRTTEAGSLEVLDAEGKPAFKAGKAVSVADLVDGFLKENAHFVAAGPGGSGAQGPGYGGGGSSTMKRSAFDALTPLQKSEAIGKGITIID